jgi:GAF domain-containing protein
MISLHGVSANEQGEMVEDNRRYANKEGINLFDNRATGYNKRLASKAMESGQPVASPTKRQLYVPIRRAAHSSGVIYVQQGRQSTVSEGQQSALERLAYIAALALDGVHRQKHLRGVLDAARFVMAPIGLEETLNAIIRSVRQTLPEIAALTLWYYDPEASVVKVGPCFGVRDIRFMQANPPDETSIVWKVMHHQKPIYAETASEEPLLANQFIQREDIASAAAFPLVADFNAVGAMFFNYRLPHHFDHEERLLFPLLAEIVAASISDAIQLENLRKQREQLDAALSVAQAIGTSVDLNAIIHKVLTGLRNLLSKTNTAPCLLLYNEDEQVLEFAPPSWEFYQIDHPRHTSVKRLPLHDQAIACRVALQSIEEGRPSSYNEGNTSNDPDYLNLITSTRSELCASLVSGDKKLLGVLVLESPQERAFDEDDVRLVEGIAQQVSVAIERARQSDQHRFTNTVAAATAWAADIAHDINREIGQIRHHAYWIGEEYEQHDKVLTHCRLIDESAGRLALKGTWGNPEPSTFALDQSIEQIFLNIIRQRDKHARLEFHGGCEAVHIHTSREQFERVLRHLGRNALEAMQGLPDRVLTAETRMLDAKAVEITITDNGPGIPEALRSSILHRPVPVIGEGGYGLMFARQMVELMGGKIRLLPPESGQGASFSIRLPLTSNGLEGIDR